MLQSSSINVCKSSVELEPQAEGSTAESVSMAQEFAVLQMGFPADSHNPSASSQMSNSCLT